MAGLHVLNGVVGHGQNLFSNVKPEQFNEALKDSNGGRDLNPADLKALAGKYNRAQRIAGLAGLANEATTGAAIYTGNVGLGVLAIVLKFANMGVHGAIGVKQVKGMVGT